MLSFGIEYDRAFSIAFWSARFDDVSAPPSFAATMIARESFEKSWPRFASAAPFLCLIVDHLLCPDIRLLSDECEEPLVHARVLRQLRVERRQQHTTVAHQHGLPVALGEHLHVRPELLDPRRPDEHGPKRRLAVLELEVGLEARHLAPVAVA